MQLSRNVAPDSAQMIDGVLVQVDCVRYVAQCSVNGASLSEFAPGVSSYLQLSCRNVLYMCGVSRRIAKVQSSSTYSALGSLLSIWFLEADYLIPPVTFPSSSPVFFFSPLFLSEPLLLLSPNLTDQPREVEIGPIHQT